MIDALERRRKEEKMKNEKSANKKIMEKSKGKVAGEEESKIKRMNEKRKVKK